MEKVEVLGTGSFLPPKVLTNEEIEKIVDTSDDWIRSRTGISERRIVEGGVSSSVLGAKAAELAMKDAGLDADEIDMIVLATSTPDMFFPSTACLVQGKLKARNAFAFDISAACSGFVYAISVGEKFIRSGTCRNALVIGSEVMSSVVDWTDRNTCVLFGDGAGAVVLGRGSGDADIMASSLFADGTLSDLIEIPGGGSRHPFSEACVDKRLHYIKMKGNETFKVAVKLMVDSVLKTIEKVGLSVSDIDMLVPHQANYRIIMAVAEKLGFAEDKIALNLQRYGNTSAASIPIALDEAWRERRIKKGDKVILCGFGGGLTWGASLINW